MSGSMIGYSRYGWMVLSGTSAAPNTMGVSKNSGAPKWMVIMENPIKMDDLGYHYFWKHPNTMSAWCWIR